MTKTWEVEVRVNGETILTIGSNHLSGVEDPDADIIRTCAEHLLGFVGPVRDSKVVTDDDVPF